MSISGRRQLLVAESGANCSVNCLALASRLATRDFWRFLATSGDLWPTKGAPDELRAETTVSQSVSQSVFVFRGGGLLCAAPATGHSAGGLSTAFWWAKRAICAHAHSAATCCGPRRRAAAGRRQDCAQPALWSRRRTQSSQFACQHSAGRRTAPLGRFIVYSFGFELELQASCTANCCPSSSATALGHSLAAVSLAGLLRFWLLALEAALQAFSCSSE